VKRLYLSRKIRLTFDAAQRNDSFPPEGLAASDVAGVIGRNEIFL
jgi:hypothetical protein